MLPMTLYYNKKTLSDLTKKPASPLPVYLYAYGGFGNIESSGHENDAFFWVNNVRGIYAVAHIRGGGEKGLSWMKQGIFPNRLNGVEDVIAAAEYLQAMGYTDVKHTAIEGTSNGGMLMAAVVNRRPDLFGAVISKVPVTDMLRFQ